MKGTTAAALAVVAVSVMCSGVVVISAVSILGAPVTQQITLASDSCGTTVEVTAAPAVDGFTAEQVRNAGVIVKVGQRMNVPARGLIIAVATAMQESELRNLGHLGKKNDHDSQGLFQQRPSKGWGTVQQITDPEHASRKFYESLLTVNGWATLPLTTAAQRVQRSAFPNAYAKHEQRAARLVGALTGGADRAPAQSAPAGQCAAPEQATASGWTIPVPGKIVSPYGQRGGRLHAGVDLAAAKRTPIKAASAGTVIKVRCNAVYATGANKGADYGCDRDGDPVRTRGCGWYVDIRHADNVITRYCHMIERPAVAVGARVTAGQQIGLAGSSGHSSGPHLHYEVHTGGDSSNAGSTDPARWMRTRGAPLTGTRP